MAWLNEANFSLFLLLNGSDQPNQLIVDLAKFLADWSIWLVPAVLILGWTAGTTSTRKLMLEATASGLIGLLIAQIIGLVWQHPRPFMIGMGHTLITHVADSSFPSDHLTLLWSVSFIFIRSKKLRSVGILLTLLGLPMAWSRIYLGVHFPLDMVGAALVGVISSWLCFRSRALFIPSAFNLVSATFGFLFASLIRRGWIRP